MPFVPVLRLWAVGSLLVCLGCAGDRPTVEGKTTFPVRGHVLFEERAVQGALVVFHPLHATEPKLVRSYARTEADGSFLLSTFKPQDGAPTGQYAVTVTLQDDKEGVELLPVRYASPQTSGLKIQVKEGDNRLPPFHLKRP